MRRIGRCAMAQALVKRPQETLRSAGPDAEDEAARVGVVRPTQSGRTTAPPDPPMLRMATRPRADPPRTSPAGRRHPARPHERTRNRSRRRARAGRFRRWTRHQGRSPGGDGIHRRRQGVRGLTDSLPPATRAHDASSTQSTSGQAGQRRQRWRSVDSRWHGFSGYGSNYRLISAARQCLL